MFTQQVFDGQVGLYDFAASPLGSLVVRDAASKITYLQQYPSGGQEVVFSATDNVMGFSWSLDGEYIAYARWGNEDIALEIMHTVSHTISRIFIAKVGDKTNLLPIATAWSPDGNKIATLTVGADGTFYHVIDVKCDAVTNNCISEQVREIPITEPFIRGKPSWAIDSAHLLLSCGEKLDELCMFDLDGRVVKRYDLSKLGIEIIRQPALSPDGKMVAFSGSRSSSDGIFAVQLDTLAIFEVDTESPGEKDGPTWGYPSH